MYSLPLMDSFISLEINKLYRSVDHFLNKKNPQKPPKTPHQLFCTHSSVHSQRLQNLQRALRAIHQHCLYISSSILVNLWHALRAYYNFTKLCTFLASKFAARFARNSSIQAYCLYIQSSILLNLHYMLRVLSFLLFSPPSLFLPTAARFCRQI